MTDPTGTDRTRRGPRLDPDAAAWVQALEVAGYRHRTALDYAETIRRAEQLLAGQNLTLRTATSPDIAALAEHWPATRSSRTRLRSALGAASVILEHPDLPSEAVPPPAGVPARRSRRRAGMVAGTPSATRRAWWDERLEALGEQRTNQPGRPAVVLEQAERLLAARGSDLAHADAPTIVALIEAWPVSYSSRVRLRRSLRLAADILERPELAAAVEVPEAAPRSAEPLSRARAERFEIAAWRVGGTAGLLALLALHTDLGVRELTRLRWEQLSAGGPGQAALVRTHAGDHPLAERLGHALAAMGRTTGYLFPSGASHITAPEAHRHLRSVAAHAGLGADVGPVVLRASRPGQVNPALVETIDELSTAHVDGAVTAGLTVEQLLATGVAKRTAHQYVRMADRAARLLAERGSDLMTCSGVDLVAIAQRLPPS